MKTKKIIILTEFGSGTKGSGHLFRSLSLYSQIKLFRKEIFINKSAKLENFLKVNKIIAKVYTKKSIQLLKKHFYEYIIIIDVYNPRLFLKKFNFLHKFKLLIFNDLDYLKTTKHILINPQKINNLNKNLQYQGLNFFPINDKLKKIRKLIKIRKKIRKIFVFLGYFPDKKLILKINNFFIKNINENIEIHIASVYNIKNFKNIKNIPIKSNYYNKIYQYDAAIISGGFIKFDLLYLGVPIFYLTLKDHQTKLAKIFSNHNLGKFINNINSINLNNKSFLNVIDNHLYSYSSRKKMFNFSRKKIDGKGSQRIFKLIKNI